MKYLAHKKLKILISCSFIVSSVFICSHYELLKYQKDGESQNIIIKSDELRDYNNYDSLKTRFGPGERGSAVYLTDPVEIAANEILYNKTGFYVLVSNKISVNRSLPFDYGPVECHTKKYPSKLPSVSIIIVFHNEVLSVLQRTLHSVLNRTPRELIHEIILVDDFSNEQELCNELPKYIKKNFGEKIKMKVLNKRSGLIVTRLEGAKMASGEILVFFDSHIEVNHNWLPPLLTPLTENKRIATVPIIDDLSSKTFDYFEMDPTRGVFDWKFNFRELPLRPQDKIDPVKPFSVPVMLGCAFAIDRKFFLDELEGYDEKLEIWNGENYELSFKLHLCADGIFKVPCSRVGHTFRDINPTRTSTNDYVARNFKRVAEVWLDSYKEVLYAREPGRYEIDEGDLKKPKEIKEKLHCKPFKHFLDVVAPDLVERYPPFVDVPVFASGYLRSLSGDGIFCLMGNNEPEIPLTLTECDSNAVDPEFSQNFVLSFFKQITQASTELCLDSHDLSLVDCHYGGGNQWWKYEQRTNLVRNKRNRGKFCLSADIDSKSIQMKPCDEADENQQWDFGYLNETALNIWNTIDGYKTIL